MVQDKLIDGKYEYFAFISYKEEDAEWAKWLQRKLEHYKLPTAIRKEKPELPERISPIYEYKSEAGGGRLKEVIWKGLTGSKYLIVICSPRAGGNKSKWLNDGINHFVSSGIEENIIPFIVEGKPKAENLNEECFPSGLLKLEGERELRGININEMGRDAAAVKVVSRMFDVKFDTLWQRHERERKRRKRLVISSIVMIAIVSMGIALWIGWQNREIQNKNSLIVEQNNSLLIEQSRYIAKEVDELISQGDYELATILAREILPSDSLNPQRPYTVEAERALRNSMNNGRIGRGYTPTSVISLHEDMIYSAQYNNNNKTILTASQDGYVKIWDAVNNKELFSVQIKEIKEALFSPNPEKILLRFYDRIALYDLGSKRVEKEVGIPQCLTVCYNKKGTLIAAASWDKIILLDGNLNLMKTFLGHKMCIQSLDFSCDDSLLASASGSIFNPIDNTVKIWDVKEGKHTKTFAGHSDEVNCVRFSPDNNHVVSASCDNTIIVWDLENEKMEGRLSGHTEFINHVEYNPIGTELVSCSYDNTIIIWDTKTLKKKQTISCDGWSDFVHYDKSGTFIVAGLWEKLVVWKKQNENNIWWHDLDDVGEDVVYSADGKRIAIKTKRGVEVLDAITHERIGKLKLNNIKEYTPIQFHPNNDHIVCFTSDNYFEIISIHNPEERIRIKTKRSVEEFVINKKGIIYATTYDDDYNLFLEGWSIDKETNVFCIETGVTTAINHLTINDKNNLLAMSCGVLSDEENFIMLWDLSSMKCIRKLEGHSEGVLCSIFSNNGERLFSVSEDHTLRCWNVLEGIEIYRHRLDDMVNSVTTSYDEELFAASSQNGYVIIGQIKTGKLVETFSIGDNINSVVVFNPNSNYLSIIYDKILCNKYFLPINDLLDIANQIPRKLTHMEKEKYYLSK